mgnify:CR=1 FL=1|tara:strand:- start:53 stop:961 length:909 start_codon:yes stop_codon:yes gene_type:complete
MKIDYKILWLDDKIKSVVLTDYEDDIEDLKEYIKSLGFKETIDFVRTEEELFSKLDEVREYDLIMTDYHLDEIKGNTRNGDDIIKTIRERDIFTEIMFYSAQGEVKDTDRLDRITFFESFKVLGDDHYEKIFRKAKELIELTVRKFQNIVAMRGMIMHETSSLDIEMKEILKFQIESSQNREELISVIKSKYIETNKDFSNEIKEMNDLESISLKIGASHRLRALKRNLPKGEIKTILNDYEKEIISIRNKFAHAVLETNENGRVFFQNKKDGLDFNQDFCREIRQNIIKHKTNLDKLKSIL